MEKKSANALQIDGGYYIPMDDPWDSDEDNAAYKLANKLFSDLRPLHEYVVIIKSCHWATHGYWVETKMKLVKFPDRIIKGGTTIQIKNKTLCQIQKRKRK